MKVLLAVFLLPFFAAAQGVTPVISKAYLALVQRRGDSLPRFSSDTTNLLSNATLRMGTAFYGGAVRRIVLRGGKVFVQPAVTKTILLGGSVQSSVEAKHASRLPALQSTFAQGRPVGGAAVWRGPETGEVFSYGPALSALEYDGRPYPYDVNGRLVPAGQGNGQKVLAYSNKLFRTALTWAQAVRLQGRYLVAGKPVLTAAVRFGHTTDQSPFPGIKNNLQTLNASLNAVVKGLTVAAQYNRSQNNLPAANRNGFLNRIYESALLTPASFSNRQGTRLNGGQRAYSSAADNPFFLLEESGNGQRHTAQSAGFSVEKKTGRLTFAVSPSWEKAEQANSEGYAPGTVGWPSGFWVRRHTVDEGWWLKATASLALIDDADALSSRVLVNYIFSSSRRTAGYTPGTQYRFQRSATDALLSSVNTFRGDDVETHLTLSNKFYAANTAASPQYFLPSVSGYVRWQRLFDSYDWTLKLAGSYNRFVSELPLQTPFVQTNLLRFSTDDAARYVPVFEATGYDGLLPLQHAETAARLELSYRHRYTLQAEAFRRLVRNDVAPVFENGLPVLKNLAAHRTTGVEVTAGVNRYSRTWQLSHTVTFSRSRNVVTHVRPGFNFTPLAGFSNVHKALVEGQPLGVIVGSRYRRNGEGRTIIGADGFPVVDAQPGVVGNPQPDFVLKTANNIGFKRFSLNLDVEWRKGGDVWNGTAAVLDYYGRSQTSAALRNVKGYVFDGVTADGRRSNRPVDFYDPSLPLERSRWVRYGQSGVAEAYVQDGTCLRLNTVAVAYKQPLRKGPQNLLLSLYANNLLLWTAYNGSDAESAFYGNGSAQGLDFFNLPSFQTLGCSVALQF